MGLLIAVALGCGAPTPSPTLADPPGDLAATARVETWRELAEDAVAVRSPADGQGRLELVEGPAEPPVVGTSATWRLRYVAGASGVASGGTVAVVVPPFWGWSPPQQHEPGSPGLVVVEGRAGLEVDVVPPGLVRVRLPRGLPPGEGFDVVYGAGPAGARVDRFAERGPAFWASVDGDGDGVRGLVPEPLRVEVAPGPPEGLVVTWPTTARPGDTVTLRVATLDSLGNATAGTGLPVRLSGGGLELPRYLRLDTAGRARLDVQIPGPGVWRVEAAAYGGVALSNPLVAHEDVEPQLWADLQVHSGASDGTGELDDVYAYARDVAGLDAVAITDHDHFGMPFLDRDPAGWTAQRDAAARWYDPGRFVTFVAYEWTSWLYGHRHVLYVGEAGPVFGSLDLATRTPEGLWAALAPYDAITIPHHVAGGPVALDGRWIGSAAVEPVVEIVSVHGASEAADAPGRVHGFRPGTTARDLLLAGHRLGFVGSTDGHDGHPGLSQIAGGQGGLAALLTDDRTRTGVASALRARRTYATNGPRVFLRVTVESAPEGVDVVARVVAPSRISRVDVIRGADRVAEVAGDGDVGQFPFRLAPVDAPTFVYVRVLLADGGAAWSSPVWLDP